MMTFFQVDSIVDDVVHLSGNYGGPISMVSLYVRKKVLVPVDASSYSMKEILESLPSIGSVEVTRDGPNKNNCYVWKVTFTSMLGPSKCPDISYCLFVDKGTFQALNVYNNSQVKGPYIMTDYFDGRPRFELLGSPSKIIYDESLQRWQLYDPYSVVVSESYSSSPFPPLTNWSSEVLVTPSDLKMMLCTSDTAKITASVIQRGVTPSFKNVISTTKLSGMVDEVQVIDLEYTTQEIYGSFILFHLDPAHNIMVSYADSAEDIKAKLETLISIGHIEVFRNETSNGHSWFVTFKDGLGDRDTLKLGSTYNIGKGTVNITIRERIKGKRVPNRAIISGLESGATYVTRAAAINSAGIGLYSTLGQNLGRGIVPFSKIAASAPSAPDLFVDITSSSYLNVKFSIPKDNGNDIDMFKVEWTTSNNFGAHEVISIQIINDVPNDMTGTLRIAFDGRPEKSRLFTTPVSVYANPEELASAIMTSPCVGVVEVSAGNSTEMIHEWLITFTQNVGRIPLPYIDTKNVISRSGLGSITSKVYRVINGTKPENYSVDFVFSNSFTCQSKYYTSFSVLHEDFCNPFYNSLNHDITTSIRDEISCAEGQLEMQVIIAEADSQLGGTFDLYYAGNVRKSIPILSSADDMKSFIASIINIQVIEVMKAPVRDMKFGVAWVIKFKTSDAIEMFAVNDRFTTGKNACVQVHPAVNITTLADEETVGVYRIHLGGEISSPISFRASQRKVLEQFHNFVGVGKATILSSELHDSMLKFEAMIDESLLLQKIPMISIVGNILSSISSSDEIVIGVCKFRIESAQFEYFKNSSIAGEIYNSKYFASKQRLEAESNGYTLIEVHSNETNLTEACGISEDVSVEVEIGSYVASRKALPGLVSFETDIYLADAVHGSLSIKITPRISNKIIPNDSISINGVMYKVKALNEECDLHECLILTTPYTGQTVTKSNIKVKVYTEIFTAYTTIDLTQHLSVSDKVYTSSDSFHVLLVEPTKLILSGHVSFICEGEKIYVDAKGAEHLVIMREFSSDLDTFRVVVDDNLKGIGARIYTKTPYYRHPSTYILGNPSEIQVVIFKTLSLHLKLNFTLGLDGHVSNSIQWPDGDGLITAEEIRSSLLSFDSVRGDVDVSVISRNLFEYIFMIDILGSYTQPAVPQLTSKLSATSNDASISHVTIRKGMAKSFSSMYFGLSESNEDKIGNYTVRVTAHNREGYGIPSNIVVAATPKIGLLPDAPKSVMLGSFYSSIYLSLNFLPPTNNGGREITKYRIEWDSSPSFLSSSENYGSDEISIQYEQQDIILECQNICSGSFSLAWGGRNTAQIPMASSCEYFEIEIAKIIGKYDFGNAPVKVSQRANGYGKIWSVTFFAILGNLGQLEADGTLLYGGNPSIRVEEKYPGKADLYPGAYTNEVQTVYINKVQGFDNVPTHGTFSLSFEDAETSQIDVSASAAEMKEALEGLNTIFTVNVETFSSDNRNAWVITFTKINEHGCGVGDINLIKAASTSLSDQTFTSVHVFENIKGTNPFQYNVKGCKIGSACYSRVSAYNALGYGPISSVSKAIPREQPNPPSIASVRVLSGSTLELKWSKVDKDGGNPVNAYLVEWYSKNGSPEIQRVTTSATDGRTEIQVVRTTATKKGLTGKFALFFKGEYTEPIDNGAPAIGEGSLEEKLSRLSTIGHISVSRDYSKTVISNELFSVENGASLISGIGGLDLTTIISTGDIIFVGGEDHIVTSVSPSTIVIDEKYNGPSTNQTYVYRWANGYEWFITFLSHIGDQPAMECYPRDGWNDANDFIQVRTLRDGANPLSGFFHLTFNGEKTIPIPHNASSSLLKDSLESLMSIGTVNVTRYNNDNGYDYFVTFLTELGNIDLMGISYSQLFGPNAKARVVTMQDGLIPDDYKSSIISSGESSFYIIPELKMGIPYFVRVRARNSEGFGDYALANPSPVAPKTFPSTPKNVQLITMAQDSLKVVWEKPENDGGSLITRYMIQWDLSSTFSNHPSPSFQFVKTDDLEGDRLCHTINIDASSAAIPRFVRVFASNNVGWSSPQLSSPLSAVGYLRPPGPIQNINAVATSSSGIMVSWLPPSSSLCEYGGDGGISVSHYIVEWDTKPDFSSPSESAVVSSSNLSYNIGGKDVVTGSKSSILNPEATYFVRVTAFNSLGSGPAVQPLTGVGPLTDHTPNSPLIKPLSSVISATSVQLDWTTPEFDGGASIESYNIEYDTSRSFDSAKTLKVPVTREVQSVAIESNVTLESQAIQASVKVVNEQQLVRTKVEGKDEIQTITVTGDEVVAEVQTISITAIDTDEQQNIEIHSDDVDEIQLIRTSSADIPEIQMVEVSVPRIYEVQQIGILISNINTLGDNETGYGCFDLNEGDPCRDIEDAISGNFTVSFDFTSCGGTGSANYCQAALSKFEPDIGIISCSIESVSDLALGGDHCVSVPVTHNFSAIEGDIGTLQYALDNLLDDSGKKYMMSPNSPHKQTAVSVDRIGRIKSKGGCSIDPYGGPAACDGEYEVLYNITFDSPISSGDVPPITIVNSNVKLDTGSEAFQEYLCNSTRFPNGCSPPIGSAADSHGSFYESETFPIYAVEFINGSQPSGTIIIDYECESTVKKIPSGTLMNSYSNSSIDFTDDSVPYDMISGQWIRYSSGSKTHYYRQIASLDFEKKSVILTSPTSTTSQYSDVEYGYYYSDWNNEEDGYSGVSNQCRLSPVHSSPEIDVAIDSALASISDWKQKLGSIPTINGSGILVSRDITDFNNNIGFQWKITFLKQPGDINEIKCTSSTAKSDCKVTTERNSSIINGDFKISTTFPHEYMTNIPTRFETSNLQWNIEPSDLKNELEAIVDNNEKVFGQVSVSRSAYVPSIHNRWSGGYTWTVTFLTRGGNIPMLGVNSSLLGINTNLSVSDEDSGALDLYQGVRNSNLFSDDDPGTARDGNQVSGSFALSWTGNSYHPGVITNNVFPIITGGIGTDRFTALSAFQMQLLLTQHLFSNITEQVKVTRSSKPTQSMGYTYSIVFSHEYVGGDVNSIVYIKNNSLAGKNSFVNIQEVQEGTSVKGTFRLRFNGETTRPINYDATGEDMQNALNQLISISPSSVVVSRTAMPLNTGPANGFGGVSTQVNGYVWTVTFASNVWKDPTEEHDLSYIPGNWFGPPASFSEYWESGFSKSWGKNVGDVNLIECIDAGLLTTTGVFPEGGCSVSELVKGTPPVSGSFSLCFDTSTYPNSVPSVNASVCTDHIDHNAVASANESSFDGTSIEEHLETLVNIGDVSVSRGSVNPKNGGYTWTVTFLYDADGPCNERDAFANLCNSPGDVPKICAANSSKVCDVSSLIGDLVVLDATDFSNEIRPPGIGERQTIIVKDPKYLGWEGGTVVDNAGILSEYKLSINGTDTDCIEHNASAERIRHLIQNVLDFLNDGYVNVRKINSEYDAPNGFLYQVTFYETGDLPLMKVKSSANNSNCSNGFSPFQFVEILDISDGSFHETTCDVCSDGVVQRGDLTVFEIEGEQIFGALPWNASASLVKSHLETTTGRVVSVSRTVLDKYGAMEWIVTFTQNPGMTPPGSGDINPLHVIQGLDSSGMKHPVVVSEVQKGSEGLSGSFEIDFFLSNGPRTVSFDESPVRLKCKLEEMGLRRVHITRDCYPSCFSGGWGSYAVAKEGEFGGYEWKIYFLQNWGNLNGTSFPSGSGNLNPLQLSFGLLNGFEASVKLNVISDGSKPLGGDFRIKINGQQTKSIPYGSSSSLLEESLNYLSNIGDVKVYPMTYAMQKIPGITLGLQRNGNWAKVTGGDLRNHLAPGDMFRLGNGDIEARAAKSSFPDGSVMIATGDFMKGSPIVNNPSVLDSLPYAGEKIRIGAKQYTVQRDGIEIQLLSVHAKDDTSYNSMYQIFASVQGYNGTTQCLSFNSTDIEVQEALNELPFIGKDGVVVVKVDQPDITFQIFKVYFEGSAVLGDMDQLQIEECFTYNMSESNFHFATRTLHQGGNVEHQRVKLASDSGFLRNIAAFRVSILDEYFNFSTPCLKWGVSSLGISSILHNNYLIDSGVVIGAKGIEALANNLYELEVSHIAFEYFIVGDSINAGGKCSGKVESVTKEGFFIEILALNGCQANIGDNIYMVHDVSVIESSSSISNTVSQITKIKMFSDSDIGSGKASFKMQMTKGKQTRKSSCLDYGVSAENMQNIVDTMFDYDESGTIDVGDKGHIVVTKEVNEYGFSYVFESKGTSTSFGTSSVLGSHAPKIEIVDIGSQGGCVDTGIVQGVLSTTATTKNSSNIITSKVPFNNTLQAGTRIKINTASNKNKIYFVKYISEDDSSFFLDETFVGRSVNGTAVIELVEGGIPKFSSEVIQYGKDEFVYDIYFTGSYWSDVPSIVVNTFGDGQCPANASHVVQGMNRNIGTQTIVNGGGFLTSRIIVISDAYDKDDEYNIPIYKMPSFYTVYNEVSEVQRIVFDNVMNKPEVSFKLVYKDEETGCFSLNSTDSDIENALNNLGELCPGGMSCVTVTRSLNLIFNPNSLTFSIYFNGNDVSNQNIPDPNEDGLAINVTANKCTQNFSSADSLVTFETVIQGITSKRFTSSQLPLGNEDSSAIRGHWLRKEEAGLSIYRVNAVSWLVEFENYLGDVPVMKYDQNTLSMNAEIKVFDNSVKGINPLSTTISNLSTGIPYFFRMNAESKVGAGSLSNIVSLTPGAEPNTLQNFHGNNVVNVKEVQSLSLVASYLNEIQTVTTSAAPIPEVHEVIIQGSSGHNTAGKFALRFPEIQIVRWSSGSPVTSGSFYLSLLYPDMETSKLTGNFTYKEMKTACLPFDASAAEVKAALEIESIENPLGVGSIEVVRSGDGSYSSSFGYSYTISFVGDLFRGNIHQISSDISLEGKDSLGGKTCQAFNAPTHDEKLIVTTINEGRAIGTDTPFAELTVSTEFPIIEGQFQLSITHLGVTRTTDCIEWDENIQNMKAKIEALDNVDSVWIDRHGNGTLSPSKTDIELIDISVSAGGSSSFLNTSDSEVNHLLFVGDHIQINEELHANKFYVIQSIEGTAILLNEPIHGIIRNTTISRVFNLRYFIYFDGQGMHTDVTESYGFDPVNGLNLLMTNQNECRTLKVMYDGVLTDYSEIPGGLSAFGLSKKYNSAHTLYAEPHIQSTSSISASLTSLHPVKISRAIVISSIESDDGDVTYTITYGENDGNLSDLVCNINFLLVESGITCNAQTVMDSNFISGYYYLGGSKAIAFNAEEEEVKTAVESIAGIRDVSVSRSSVDGQGGYTWSITFIGNNGNIEELVPSNSLVGKGTRVIVKEIQRGNEIGGSFTLSYGFETTSTLDFNADNTLIESALEDLLQLNDVTVSSEEPLNTEGGKKYFVTFNDYIGDAVLLRADTANLTGVGSTITVMEEVKGSLATADSLQISFDYPTMCSVSQVTYDSCGSSITDSIIEIDRNIAFSSAPTHKTIHPNYHVQIIKTSSNSFIHHKFEQASIFGEFHLIFNGYESSPLKANASENDIRTALESLPGIETVSVVKSLSSYIIPDVCIDVKIGSSTVSCSAACSCNFGSIGLHANKLIKVGEKWFRVSSSYSGSNVEFELGQVINSSVNDYLMENDLFQSNLLSWAGGYEWKVTFHRIEGEIMPLSSPKHRLYPSDSVLEISLENCDGCYYVGGLSAWEKYFLRGKARNIHGWSKYTDVISATPKSIPSAPNQVQLRSISGSCIEATFYPPTLPPNPKDIEHYVIEWDEFEDFRNIKYVRATCLDGVFGACMISSSSKKSFYKKEICGLDLLHNYFVRVAAKNSVEVESFDGTNAHVAEWSDTISIIPQDQVPTSPYQVQCNSLGRSAVQIVFDLPHYDGGQPITDYIVSWSEENSSVTQGSVNVSASSIDFLIPDVSLVLDLNHSSFRPWVNYDITMRALNSIGIGQAIACDIVTITSIPSKPKEVSITALTSHDVPSSEVLVEWDSIPEFEVDNYLVEWWSAEKSPEIQVVSILYELGLSKTTFSLSFSPSAEIKRETAAMPWNASASLVRRELLNIGYDETDDKLLLYDVSIERSENFNGLAWTITFGNIHVNLGNDGDQVMLTGNVFDNGDKGKPALFVSTTQNGKRPFGFNEIQILQVSGTGTLSGFYRLKTTSSEYSPYISANAKPEEIQNALEQLTTTKEIQVTQHDDIDHSLGGVKEDMIHYYEIMFLSNSGNIQEILIDSEIRSTNNDANIIVEDGDNSLNAFNFKSSRAHPGELPCDYSFSSLLDRSTNTFNITGLKPGKEYFVSVTASNDVHGFGKRSITSPKSIIPPIQVPSEPLNVSLLVNPGHSDSLLITFDSPSNDGGDMILRYRVELDSSPSFNYPIVEYIDCPTNNKKTIWKIETDGMNGGKIDGGSYKLQLHVNGLLFFTEAIPYNAVPMARNEVGISDEIPNKFNVVNGSNYISMSLSANAESIVFKGDRLRFNEQTRPFEYYEVESVTGSLVSLTTNYDGANSTSAIVTRYYGGRGDPMSSLVYCEFDTNLCPLSVQEKSGSIENKIKNTIKIERGIRVDRDGPNENNGFVWRITFLDDEPFSEKSFMLSVAENSLTTFDSNGFATVKTTLMDEGETFSSCVGTFTIPPKGGLVKGLEYFARVSGINSKGYSLPATASQSQTPKVVPGAPIGVTLEVVSATELRVHFLPPYDNGGDTITKYLIEWSKTSNFEDSKSNTLEYLAGGAPFFKTINDLTPGNYYFVRVSAYNSQGYGLSQISTPNSLNPHQKPSRPIDVKLVVTSDSMLTVGWNYPLNDGGDTVTKYKIEWDTTPGFSSGSFPPHKGFVEVESFIHSSYTIEQLSGNRKYFVRVFAVNNAGIGAPQISNPSFESPNTQVPGIPHSLKVLSGKLPGEIDVMWQRPMKPHHLMPCAGNLTDVNVCPVAFDGNAPASDGGEPIIEYEIEYNERSDFEGTDRGRKVVATTSCTLSGLIESRKYFIRVLARNIVGSGPFCEKVFANAAA